MNPERKEVQIFNAALELPTPAERAAYLDRACAEDEPLRRKVETLLQACGEAEDFFKTALDPQPRPSGSPTVLVPITEKPGDRIGRYKLLQQIGEGGCGVVFMAEQEEPVRRRVALKVIKLGMDTRQVIARFEAERQALALMDHPNIAKFYDAGVTTPAGSEISNFKSQIQGGRPYFVMELVRGVRLTEFCEENHLSMRQRLDLFVLVCHAVQHAHQKGIIHRDLKPSNILVTVNDGVPVPKVIDFGIAKATTGQQLTDKTLFTAFEQFMGTPAYMSPEQAVLTSLDIDTRSDIYSLGVLLYELLTGKTPFDARELWKAGVDEMRRTIREVEPVKPSTRLTLERLATSSAGSGKSEIQNLKSEIDKDLDWIVMKALEKDRARRYETASGFAADVLRHLNHEAVIARPPSLLYKFQKAVRRNKPAFAAAAAVLLALLAGLGLTAWQAVRASKAEQAARGAEQAERTQAEKARTDRDRAVLAEAKAQEMVATELQAKSVALIERQRAEDALDRAQIQVAEIAVARGDMAAGLAGLASVLGHAPTNRMVAERIFFLLSYGNFPVPITPPLIHDEWITSSQFSADGLRVLTSSADNTARVWDAQTGTPLGEVMRHDGMVWSARFSPDGLRVVTASGDKTARIWDARTGEALSAQLTHAEDVYEAQFSLDGLQVLTAAGGRESRATRVWDGRTGKPLSEPLRYGTNGWTRFSPDGSRVLTFGTDHAVRLWDARTGKFLAEPLKHSNDINYAEFSPDGLRLVTASDDSTARVWDAHTGKPLTEPLRHNDWVMTASFSPDGLRLVAIIHDQTAQIWDTQTGKPITETIQHDRLQFGSARFSPDGLRLVTGSGDRTARVWDARTGKPLGGPMRHDYSVNLGQFSPDGKRVLITSGIDGNSARVWDPSPRMQSATILRHGGHVRVAQFSPDGLRVVTGNETSMRVWDARSGKPLTELLQHDAISTARLSPDGLRMVTIPYENPARVWEVQTGRHLTTPLGEGKVNSTQFSPDGLRVVTASSDNAARVWDAQTGKPLTEPLRHGSRVESAEFSPDGLRVVTASFDKTARVWDAQTGKPLTEPLRHGSRVESAQFSPDGLRVATASDDRTARVWDSHTGKPLTRPLWHDDGVGNAQFSPDGRHMITFSGYSARIWDAQNGKLLTEPLRHDTIVKSAQFSSDGLRVVTASHDGTARVWDAQTGNPLTEPLRHDDSVYSAQFSPDGLHVVTASADGTARIWPMSFPSEPAPSWLPALATAVGGKRLTETGALEPVSPEQFQQFLELKQRLLANPATNFSTRWAQWFLGDHSKGSNP